MCAHERRDQAPASPPAADGARRFIEQASRITSPDRLKRLKFAARDDEAVNALVSACSGPAGLPALVVLFSHPRRNFGGAQRTRDVLRRAVSGALFQDMRQLSPGLLPFYYKAFSDVLVMERDPGADAAIERLLGDMESAERRQSSAYLDFVVAALLFSLRAGGRPGRGDRTPFAQALESADPRLLSAVSRALAQAVLGAAEQRRDSALRVLAQCTAFDPFVLQVLGGSVPVQGFSNNPQQRLALLSALQGPPPVFLTARTLSCATPLPEAARAVLDSTAARPACKATQAEADFKAAYVVYKRVLGDLLAASPAEPRPEELAILPLALLADVALLSDARGSRCASLEAELSRRAASAPGAASPLDPARFTSLQPVTGAKLLGESLVSILLGVVSRHSEEDVQPLLEVVASDLFGKLPLSTEDAHRAYLRVCVLAFSLSAGQSGPLAPRARTSALDGLLGTLGSAKYSSAAGEVVALFTPLLRASLSLAREEREAVLSALWRALWDRYPADRRGLIASALARSSGAVLAALRSCPDQTSADLGFLLWHLCVWELGGEYSRREGVSPGGSLPEHIQAMFAGHASGLAELARELRRVRPGPSASAADRVALVGMAAALGLFPVARRAAAERAALVASFACTASYAQSAGPGSPDVLRAGLLSLLRGAPSARRLGSLGQADTAALETPAGQLSAYRRARVERPSEPRNQTLKQEQDYKAAMREYEGQLALLLAAESETRASLLETASLFREDLQAACTVAQLCRGRAFRFPRAAGADADFAAHDCGHFCQEAVSFLASLCGSSPLLTSLEAFSSALVEGLNLLLAPGREGSRVVPLAAVSPRLLLLAAAVLSGCAPAGEGERPGPGAGQPAEGQASGEPGAAASAFSNLAREALSQRMLGPQAAGCTVCGVALSTARAPTEGRGAQAFGAQDAVTALSALRAYLAAGSPAVGASAVALLFQFLCRAFTADSRALVPQRARLLCLQIICEAAERSASCPATAEALRRGLNFDRAFQLLGEATAMNMYGEQLRTASLALARLVPVSAESLRALIAMLADAEGPALRRLAADALAAVPLTGSLLRLDEASYCTLLFSESEFESVRKFFVSCGREAVLREHGPRLALFMVELVVRRCLACLEGCGEGSGADEADRGVMGRLRDEFGAAATAATAAGATASVAASAAAPEAGAASASPAATALQALPAGRATAPPTLFEALKLCEFYTSRLPPVLVTLCTECTDKGVFLAVLRRLVRLYQICFCPLEEVQFSAGTLHGLLRKTVLDAVAGLSDFFVNRDAPVLDAVPLSGSVAPPDAFPLRAGLVAPPYSTAYPMACDVAPERQAAETLERRRKREEPLVVSGRLNEHLARVPYTGEPGAFVQSLRHSDLLFNEVVGGGEFAPELRPIEGEPGPSAAFTYAVLLSEIVIQHGLTETDPALNEGAVSCLLNIVSVYGRYYVKRLQYLRDINRRDLADAVIIEPVSAYLVRRVCARALAVLEHGAICGNTLDDRRQATEAQLLELGGLVRCLGQLVYYLPDARQGQRAARAGADPLALRALVSATIDEVLRVRDTSAKRVLATALVEFFPRMLEGAHSAHAYGVPPQAEAFLERYGHTLLYNYQTYPGSAYALAGACKAVGLAALLQHKVLETYILPLVAGGLSLEETAFSADSTGVADEEKVDAAVLAFESLYLAYGTLLEPYATTILRYILPMPAQKTQRLLSLMLSNMTKFGASFLLPTLLSAMNYDSSWREKKGACEVIKAIAVSENRTVLSALLPSLMPVFQRLLHDTHREVARSVNAALDSVVLSVRNPEVRKISRDLVRAFGDIGLLRQALVSLAEVTFSSRLDASSLTILVPLCERALLVPSTEIYVAGADRMVGTHTKVIACMCLSVIFRLTRPQDLRLYLSRLKAVLRGALGDALAEIRSSAARALSTLLHVLPSEAEGIRDELWAEMYKTQLTVNESHGLAEAICSVSDRADRIVSTLVDVFGFDAETGCVRPEAARRRGNRLAFVLLLLYLPQKLVDREAFARRHLDPCVRLTLGLAADESQTIRTEITGRIARQLCTTFLDGPASVQVILRALASQILSDSTEVSQLCLTLVGDIVCELGSQLTREEEEQGKERREINIKIFIPETAIARAVAAMTRPMYLRLMMCTYLLRFHPDPDLHHLAINTWKAVVYKPVPLMEEFLGQIGPLLAECYHRASEGAAGGAEAAETAEAAGAAGTAGATGAAVTAGNPPAPAADEPPADTHASRAARLARDMAAAQALREAQFRREMWTAIPEGAITELVKYVKEAAVPALSGYAVGVLRASAGAVEGGEGAEGVEGAGGAEGAEAAGGAVDTAAGTAGNTAEAPATPATPITPTTPITPDLRPGCLHILAALVELCPASPELTCQEVTGLAAENLSNPSIEVATAAARLFGNLNKHGIIGEAALAPLVDRVFTNPRAIRSLAGIVQQQGALLTPIMELILQREITDTTQEVVAGLFSRVESPSALVLRVLRICASQIRARVGAAPSAWVGLDQAELEALMPLLGVSRSCFQALRRGLGPAEYRFQLAQFTSDAYESDPTVSLLFLGELCRGDSEVLDDPEFAASGLEAVVEAMGRANSAALVSHACEGVASAISALLQQGTVAVSAFLGARDALGRALRVKRLPLAWESPKALKPLVDVFSPMISTKYPLQVDVDPLVRRAALEFSTLLVLASAGATLPESTARVLGYARAGPAAEPVPPPFTAHPESPDYTVSYGDAEYACSRAAHKAFVVSLLGKIVLAFNEAISDPYRHALAWSVYVCLTCGPDSAKMFSIPLQTILERKGLQCADPQVRGATRGCLVRLAEISARRETVAGNVLELLVRPEFRPEHNPGLAASLLSTLAAVLPASAGAAEGRPAPAAGPHSALLLRVTDALTNRYLLGIARDLFYPAARCVAVAVALLPAEQAVKETVVLVFGPDDQASLRQAQHCILSEMLAIPSALPVLLSAAAVGGSLMSWLLARAKLVGLGEAGAFCRVACRLCEAASASQAPQVRALLAVAHQCLSRVVHLLTDEEAPRASAGAVTAAEALAVKLEALGAVREACDRVSPEVGRLVAIAATPLIRSGLSDRRPAVSVEAEGTLISAYRLRLGPDFAQGVIDSVGATNPALGNELRTYVGMLTKRIQSGKI